MLRLRRPLGRIQFYRLRSAPADGSIRFDMRKSCRGRCQMSINDAAKHIAGSKDTNRVDAASRWWRTMYASDQSYNVCRRDCRDTRPSAADQSNNSCSMAKYIGSVMSEDDALCPRARRVRVEPNSAERRADRKFVPLQHHHQTTIGLTTEQAQFAGRCTASYIVRISFVIAPLTGLADRRIAHFA